MRISGVISVAAVVLFSSALYAANWSNQNPQTITDQPIQLLSKHESNMTDLYAGPLSKLNLLRTNFASNTPPLLPVKGQRWYDTTNKYLQIYDGGWGGGGFYSTGLSTFGALYIGVGAIDTLNVLALVKTDTSVATDLNADYVDGYHAGNDSSQIAVSTGAVNTNLNADLLDGQHGSYYLRPGVQNDVTASRTIGTVYQNATGLPMRVTATAGYTNGSEFSAYAGASNPPTTLVSARNAIANSLLCSVRFIVMPGHYYKTTHSGVNPLVYSWVERY
jgi:hypothetical protein